MRKRNSLFLIDLRFESEMPHSCCDDYLYLHQQAGMHYVLSACLIDRDFWWYLISRGNLGYSLKTLKSSSMYNNEIDRKLSSALI